MFHLKLLTSGTLLDILGNITLHIVPPVSLIHILVHLFYKITKSLPNKAINFFKNIFQTKKVFLIKHLKIKKNLNLIKNKKKKKKKEEKSNKETQNDHISVSKKKIKKYNK